MPQPIRNIVVDLPLPLDGGFVVRVRIAVTVALTRRRERQHLSRLNAHLLRDIGLNAQDARTECAKPFWRS